MRKKQRIDKHLLFPPRCKIAFYRTNGSRIGSTRERQVDLTDAVVPFTARRTIVLGLSTRSKLWKNWTESNLKRIEDLIRYDFGFDGLTVRIRRVSKRSIPCEKEFRWKLSVYQAR